MNKDIMRAAGFGKAVERFERGLCAMCGAKINDFRDALSEKEYSISGMCQKCQDSIFGK